MKIQLCPAQWEKILGVRVLDRDGWAAGTYDSPITFDNFIERCMESTMLHFDYSPETYRDIAKLAI